MNPGVRLSVGHQHPQFWPILARFVHNYSLFWGLGLFPRLMNPGARFRVGHNYSQFSPILASFMDYYLLFWGCGVISTIDEPRGAFTCRSSTLAVFIDSGLFHGLLLTVLVSRTDFHD